MPPVVSTSRGPVAAPLKDLDPKLKVLSWVKTSGTGTFFLTVWMIEHKPVLIARLPSGIISISLAGEGLIARPKCGCNTCCLIFLCLKCWLQPLTQTLKVTDISAERCSFELLKSILSQANVKGKRQVRHSSHLSSQTDFEKMPLCNNSYWTSIHHLRFLINCIDFYLNHTRWQ
ncbi:hypothetical protein RF11_04908 [Thelohanellus kitauei]|uniref:Uncharacterized protein n=1 Tax=Thelohanellus kitauei TaxID=669202 RepID=A0A0C2NEL6_THEKT|nr:hypothetical protein RF11_04908 [Thelohanellus kitauei]